MSEGASPPPHICFYSETLLWDPWRPSAVEGVEERTAKRVPVCPVCGRQRTALRPRPPVRREARAAVRAASPYADAPGRLVARVLLRKSGGVENAEVPAPGVLSTLARRGVPASLSEEWIDHFLRAGFLTARWLMGRRSNRLDAVYVRDVEGLQEAAFPGAEARRKHALATAYSRLAALSHPKAREIEALLHGEEAETLDAEVIQALAAIAEHAGTGETLAERVFSARSLGDSKALSALRGRLERLVGPLAEIGIREGASVTLLGGRGQLRIAGATPGTVDLAVVAPFAGFARETLEAVREIAFPPNGLFVVENLTAFEACCRGEVAAAAGCLIAWSNGYPGRGMRGVVERAVEAGAPIRVWADLDIDGVRIARLIASWAPPGVVGTWCMAPADVAAAPAFQPLHPRAIAALRRDLAERPEGMLADTVRALLEHRRWAEQEAFLGRPAA